MASNWGLEKGKSICFIFRHDVFNLTLDYYNQPPTKSAVFSNKSSEHAEKKFAQNTPICSFEGLLSILVHEVEKSVSLLSLCLIVSFWGQWKTLYFIP